MAVEHWQNAVTSEAATDILCNATDGKMILLPEILYSKVMPSKRSSGNQVKNS